MSNRFVCANWKMNKTLPECVAWLDRYVEQVTQHPEAKQAEQIVCAPFVFLTTLVDAVQSYHDRVSLHIAAQDVSQHPSGAYTGDISCAMLKSIGVHTAIVGHSERRQGHHESDVVVADKVVQLLRNDMTPIFCVGETLEQYERNETQQVLRAQMDALFSRIREADLAPQEGDATASVLTKMIVAYEPVWAIGTGLQATPEEAETAIAGIGALIEAEWGSAIARHIPKLYGGSVNGTTLARYLEQGSIAGSLVGGASLDAEQFAQLTRITGSVVRGDVDAHV